MSAEGVSLVATVKNEERAIDSFLASLFAQTELPDEIVLVDGGSTDRTADAITAAAMTAPIAVRLLEAPGSSIAAGRNRAIEHAAGPIVAVTDAGTEIDPDWLANLVRPLREDPSLAVSAGFFLPGGSTFFERCLSAVITPQLPEIDPDSFLPSSRSVAFRKLWWGRVGGYPEWLQHCEDVVFDLELRRVGASFAFTPDATVRWTARSSLPTFARQYFAYARGDGQAALWPVRHVVRYGAYLTGIGLILAGRRRSWAWSILAACAPAYLRRFYRRLVRLPPWHNGREAILAVGLTPIIVVTGDCAKMLGYPRGLLERRRLAGRKSRPAARNQP